MSHPGSNSVPRPSETLTKSAETVVFAHANGYPPGSYQALLAPIAQHHDVLTMEHRPLWIGDAAPRTLSWNEYALDLAARIDRDAQGPVWLVGHSMGAVTGIIAALRRPDLVRGIVALDPVLVPFRYWLMARVMINVLRQNIPIAQRAENRPHHFQSYEAAFQFYRSKRPFQRVSDAVLWDYVRAGHREVPQHGVELRWSGAWEACVYRSVPYLFHRLRRLQIPMLGIAGNESDVLGSEALRQWQAAAPRLELEILTGGHLIPLERPEECGALVVDFIGRHSGDAPE